MIRRGLYYITHVDNLASILKIGIMSHGQMERQGIPYARIYDTDIVYSRHSKYVGEKSLWDFANLYFQPRNAMLYRVLLEISASKIAVIGINQSVLQRKDIFISDGNAAHSETKIYSAAEANEILPQIRKETQKDWWAQADGSKRQLMAECLIPEKLDPQYIDTIYVANDELQKNLSQLRKTYNVPVVVEPAMFFLPESRNIITDNLSVLRGDMFFSDKQTLTVSVNCVGVMGKGLASRAKYQFPDVYVRYQDLCRKRVLRPGKPVLYKREESMDFALADDPSTLKDLNKAKWFLLFPTKDEWRYPSQIDWIDTGLKWLKDCYAKEGIKSLAMPALGCGLGKLKWEDGGPLMVKYLADFEIPVEIYLPAERSIPEQFLTKEFLLTGDKGKLF